MTNFNGFAPVDPALAMFQQFLTAPDEDARYPFLEEGTHDLVLVDFDHYPSKKNGLTLTADFYVVSSTNPKHAAGSFARKSFMVQKQVANFPTFGERESARARALIGAMLHGQALTLPPEFCQKFGLAQAPLTIDKENAATAAPATMYLLGATDVQPARGIAVRAHGTRTAGKPDPTTGQPRDGFVNFEWETIPGQTPEAIVGWRSKIDQIVGAVGAKAQPTGPQPGPHAAQQPQYAPPQAQPAPVPQQPQMQASPFGQQPAAAPAAPAQPGLSPSPFGFGGSGR